MPFDFGPIHVLTFDCYGTLVDWEAGILAGLRHVIGSRGTDDELLEAYATAEAEAEAAPWLPYRGILAVSLQRVAEAYGVNPTDEEVADFSASVADWPAFPDSARALALLAQRYKLGVITNCDDDLFATSNAKLGEPFTWVITAQQLQSYKPNKRNFEMGLERINYPRERVLHVAQSLFHDHVPAKEIGLATAWINRRHERDGFGATPPASATPDVVAPDMATFADMALA